MGGVQQYDRTRFDNQTEVTEKSTRRQIFGEALYRNVPIGLVKGKTAMLKILKSQQETKKGKTSGKKRKNRSHSPNSEKDKKVRKMKKTKETTKKGKTSGKRRRNRSHSPNSEKDKKVRKIEKSNSTTDDRESNSDRHDRERKGRPPNHSM